jgi:hypothetical protein
MLEDAKKNEKLAQLAVCDIPREPIFHFSQQIQAYRDSQEKNDE